MMPAAKQFDIVMGVDIHIILIPTPGGPVPTPLPNPFIGMVFDPMDFIPIVGATVMVNGIPRAQAGTSAKNLPPHLPLGGPFQKPPANEGEMFMGSLTVLADGEPFTYMALPVLTCNDFGIPPPPRAKKKGGVKSMMLPTSVVLPIPGGLPVLVGGPPMISLTAMAMKIGLAALGKLAKKLKKKPKKPKKPPHAPSTAKKKCPFEPVDVATGMVFADAQDFELEGVFPLEWNRRWYSDSDYDGPLGHGWHGNHDVSLIVTDEWLFIRLPDGREVSMEKPQPGASVFEREEGITLWMDGEDFVFRDRDLDFFRLSPCAQPKFKSKRENVTGHYLLSALTDLHGKGIRYRRDSFGLLSEITASAGAILHVQNTPEGRIERILAPHPDRPDESFELIRYAYNDKGDLIRGYDAYGHTPEYTYEDHLMIKNVTRTHIPFYWEYEGKGTSARCVHTWGEGGLLEGWLQYFPDEGKTVVKYSEGAIVTYFHIDGIVYKEIDGLGGVHIKRYNEHREVIAEVDPLGNTTLYEYDDMGRQKLIVDANGASIQIEHNEMGQPVKATDQAGGNWAWAYNELFQMIERIDPLGNKTLFNWSKGNLTEIVNAQNGVTRLTYDQFSNITDAVTPDGQRSTFVYDRLGRCTERYDPKGNRQFTVYDLKGRPIRIDEPDGNTVLLEYNEAGNVVRAKDKQHDVSMEYFGLGHLKSRTENGTRIDFQYDTEERLIAIVNEHRQIYRFILDVNGNVSEEYGFDGLKRTYKRDRAGRVTEVLRPGNRSTQYQYDALGQVIGVVHSDGTQETFKYRADGLIAEAVNQHIKVNLEYDLMGQLLCDKQGGYEVFSNYDSLGERIAVWTSLGANFNIGRNNMGDVEQVSATNWQTRFKRDIMGLELEREFTGGLRARWSRDKLGRPLRQEIMGEGGIQQRQRTYRWEVNDRLKEIQDSYIGISKFEHDALGNLSSAQYGDGTFDFRMPDAVGNLFKNTKRDDRKYGPAGQLLQSDSARFEYDAEGNLIKKIENNGKTWQYEWDMSGMMVRVIRPDGQTVAFEYDAMGRRIAKSWQGVTTRWVWDGDTPIHEWTEPSEDYLRPVRADLPGSKGQTFAPAPESITTWLFEPESFAPLAKIKDGQTYGIVTDHLGTPLSMHAPDGRMVWSADLNIYGKTRNLAGAINDCPFRYPGQYEDAETGLYYNRFRYYDPENGLYISQDPIGTFGSENLYAYVEDINKWTDPKGLIPLNQGGYTVYALYEKGARKPYYIGITNDYDRRMGEHIASGRLDTGRSKILDADLTYAQARGMEQAMIETHGTKTGFPGNEINSFNTKRTDYRGRTFKKHYNKTLKTGHP